MRKTPTRLTLVRTLRAFAALLSLLLVGAQLTSIGHHVLVAHYLCAEHGTLHHGDAPELRLVERAGGPAAIPTDGADHGTHDDCAFPARTPAEMDLSPAVELPTPELVSHEPLVTAARLETHASIPLLALAPKLSPPRA